jgi:hypothetical protein
MQSLRMLKLVVYIVTTVVVVVMCHRLVPTSYCIRTLMAGHAVFVKI